MIKKQFVINPDSASKRLHYKPNADGRCKLKDIKNPIYVDSIKQVDRRLYPKKNDCFWCIRNKPNLPF